MHPVRLAPAFRLYLVAVYRRLSVLVGSARPALSAHRHVPQISGAIPPSGIVNSTLAASRGALDGHEPKREGRLPQAAASDRRPGARYLPHGGRRQVLYRSPDPDQRSDESVTVSCDRAGQRAPGELRSRRRSNRTGGGEDRRGIGGHCSPGPVVVTTGTVESIVRRERL